MSIYLATKLAAGSNGSAPFEFRGIKGYTQATPSALHVDGIPSIREVAYAGYKDNIDVFMAANILEKKLSIAIEGAKVPVGKGMPLRVGPVAFTIGTGVTFTSDAEDRLLTSLPGATKERVGRVTKFIVPQVTFELAMKLTQFTNPNFGTGRKELSPMGAVVANFILFGITEFLATNSYPAFHESGVGDVLPETYAGEMTAAHTEMMEGGASDTYGFEDDQISRGAVQKRRKLLAEKMEGLTAEENKFMKLKTGRAVRITNARDMVWMATPKRSDPSINYGPASSVPAISGHVFPYFEGMNAPDPLTLKMSLTSFFMRLLGDSLEEVKKTHSEYRSACGNVAGTDIGMALAHMLTGVQLALRCQARLYIVIESAGYKGFCLLGWNYSIFDGTKWVDPVPAKDLRRLLSNFDSHSSNLMTVCEWLSSLQLKSDGDIEEVTPQEINSGRDLAKEIAMRRVVLDDEEVMVQVETAMRGLYFGEPYLLTTPENIKRFLDQVVDAESPLIPDSGPMYIYQLRGDYTDKVYTRMLQFGPEAPVPMTTTGQEFAIPAPEKADPIFDPLDEGAKPLEALAFYLKPPHVATLEWKAIAKKKTIRINLKERSGPFRAVMYRDGVMKKELWKRVRAFAFQKREVEDKEMPAAKKPKLTKEDDILKLFA